MAKPEGQIARALRSADMPTPEMRDDEVLVEVHAAAVNLLPAEGLGQCGRRFAPGSVS